METKHIEVLIAKLKEAAAEELRNSPNACELVVETTKECAHLFEPSFKNLRKIWNVTDALKDKKMRHPYMFVAFQYMVEFECSIFDFVVESVNEHKDDPDYILEFAAYLELLSRYAFDNGNFEQATEYGASMMYAKKFLYECKKKK